GHHLALIGFLQPLENDRGVQATGIGQNYLLNVRHAISSRRGITKTVDSSGADSLFTGARQLVTTRRHFLAAPRPGFRKPERPSCPPRPPVCRQPPLRSPR